MSFAPLTILWEPESYGQFGLNVGNDSRVSYVAAGSPAAAKSISVGDTVFSPNVRDRAFLGWGLTPRPGQTLTIQVGRDGRSRAIVLRATPIAPLSTLDRAGIIIAAIAGLLGVGFGLLLALLIPNPMTWGFYIYTIFALNWALGSQNSGPLSALLPVGWLIAFDFAGDLLGAAALVGLLVFCIRFPDVTPRGWRAVIDRNRLAWFCLAGVLCTAPDVFPLVARSTPLQEVGVACIAVGLAAALFAFATNFRLARDLRRQKMMWVALGLGCTAASILAFVLDNFGLISDAIDELTYSLAIVFPLTVAYAVIRQRVIDVRFVLSRSLFFAIVAAVVVATLFAFSGLVGGRLPSSSIEAVAYVALGLACGLALSVGWRRLADAVDFVLFRPWFNRRRLYDGVEKAIRDGEVSRIGSALTHDLAEVFSLSSAALFESMEDGGFVRVAAYGWPQRTMWHILSDDPLVARIETLRPADLDGWRWPEQSVPAGTGCPILSVPVVRGREVAAFVLVGAHRDGTAIAPDEVHMLRHLCADAGLALKSATFARLIVNPAE